MLAKGFGPGAIAMRIFRFTGEADVAGRRDILFQSPEIMESEFVEFDVAAFAGECVGIGREAIDAAAIGEFEDASGEVVAAIENDNAQIDGGKIEDFGPGAAVVAIEEGLTLIARADPDIELGIGRADDEDEVKGIGDGGTDLARFLPDFERPIVIDPGGLGREEPVAAEKLDFCFRRLLKVTVGYRRLLIGESRRKALEGFRSLAHQALEGFGRLDGLFADLEYGAEAHVG